jgi:hypothetical protein
VRHVDRQHATGDRPNPDPVSSSRCPCFASSVPSRQPTPARTLRSLSRPRAQTRVALPENPGRTRLLCVVRHSRSSTSTSSSTDRAEAGPGRRAETVTIRAATPEPVRYVDVKRWGLKAHIVNVHTVVSIRVLPRAPSAPCEQLNSPATTAEPCPSLGESARATLRR